MQPFTSAEARYPEVEYGWIQPGGTLVDSLVNPLLRVSRFWEKPASRRAEVLRRRGLTDFQNTPKSGNRVATFRA